MVAVFLGGFLTLCTTGNKHLYSMDELLNLQVHPVFLRCLVKLKITSKHHIFKSFLTVFYYLTANLNMSYLKCFWSCVRLRRLYNMTWSVLWPNGVKGLQNQA